MNDFGQVASPLFFLLYFTSLYPFRHTDMLWHEAGLLYLDSKFYRTDK